VGRDVAWKVETGAYYSAKIWGIITALPPTWVGQRRVKSTVEESQTCVMMTSVLQLTRHMDIFAVELENLSSSSAMTSRFFKAKNVKYNIEVKELKLLSL
jgi:hypothetical protein